MNIEVVPFGQTYEWSNAASITELSYGQSGLRVVVSAPIGSDAFVEIFLPGANAFQVLPNADHLGYWGNQCFETKHLVYKFVKGGWLARVGEHYMQVLKTDLNQSEWLIVSTDHCVSVVSGSEPLIRPFT